MRVSTRFALTAGLAIAASVLLPGIAIAQTAPSSGERPARLIIRNATVVDGNGTPAKGPFDIVVEGDTIKQVVAIDPVAMGRGRSRPQAGAGTVEIDATGKYVTPGLINAHAHLQDERGGKPQPIEYETKIWLACGITTIRDVGSDTKKALAWRAASARGELAAPRILIYPMYGVRSTPEAARTFIRSIKAQGADGVKITGIDRDVMEALADEAHKQGLRIA
ncbi:MAG TPA: hypothetical protein VN614_05505, partial [Rhodanobacter sp.]|nr:hypothetical protein [Rhodanobacter sp.]